MVNVHRCPNCKAFVNDSRVRALDGQCPYCGEESFGVLMNGATARRRAAGPLREPVIPRDRLGKFARAFKLLFDHLPLFAALVLSIWLPARLLIWMGPAHSAGPGRLRVLLQLTGLITVFFGPIYAGAILHTLANAMSGIKTSYLEAMGAGLRAWGKLLLARLVAGLLIVSGLILLVIPGILLAMRCALVDEVVVLEGESSASAPWRSAGLIGANVIEVLRATLLSVFVIVCFFQCLSILRELIGTPNNLWLELLCYWAVDVFAAFTICLFFLYYWEARDGEALLQCDFAEASIH
jgi:hypothetical protein